MKNLLFVLLFVFASNIVISQEFDIEWKNPFNRENITDKSIVISSDPSSSEYYVLRESASVSDPFLWLEKYSYPEGNLFVKTIPKNEGTFSENVLYEKFLVGKNQFLFFYRGWSKEAKKSSYLVRSCSLGGEYTKDAKELDSHIAQNKLKAGDYDIAISPNKSMFALLMTFPYEKDTKEKVRIKVFDAISLSEKWSKDITMSIESEKGTNNNLAIDDNGNLYLFKRIAEKNNFIFHLYTVNSNLAEFKEIPMSIPEGTIISQFKLLMTPQSNLYVTGLYSAKTNVVIDGSFCIKINTGTQQIDLCKFNLFGDRISGLTPGVGLQDIVLKDIIFMSNGSYQIIAENQKENISSKVDPTGKAIYDGEILSNKIIIMCYKIDGTRDWEATVNKNQNFKTTERVPTIRWDSFTYGLVNDNLYIIYNNLNLQEKWKELSGAQYQRIQFEKASYCPFMFVVEPNGNIKFGDKIFGLPLFTLYKNSIINSCAIFPGFAVSNNSGLIIMCGTVDGKKAEFGKIKLK